MEYIAPGIFGTVHACGVRVMGCGAQFPVYKKEGVTVTKHMNNIHTAQALLIISKSCARESPSRRSGDAARNAPEGQQRQQTTRYTNYVTVTNRGACHRPRQITALAKSQSKTRSKTVTIRKR